MGWSCSPPGSAGKHDPFDAGCPALVKQALGDGIQLSTGRADVVY